MADAIKKNRIPRGERRFASKLTREKLEAAATLRKNGWSYWRIAERFNVCQPTVWKALNGQTWTHIEV